MSRKFPCDILSATDAVSSREYYGLVEIEMQTSGADIVLLTPENALAFAADIVAAADRAAEAD